MALSLPHWPVRLARCAFCRVSSNSAACRRKAATEERFNLFIILLLAPASAIRASDALSRPLLEEFHPLAVARVLSKADDFHELAAQSLRELTYPDFALVPPGDCAPARYAQESQRLLLGIME